MRENQGAIADVLHAKGGLLGKDPKLQGAVAKHLESRKQMMADKVGRKQEFVSSRSSPTGAVGCRSHIQPCRPTALAALY